MSTAAGARAYRQCAQCPDDSVHYGPTPFDARGAADAATWAHYNARHRAGSDADRERRARKTAPISVVGWFGAVVGGGRW